MKHINFITLFLSFGLFACNSHKSENAIKFSADQITIDGNPTDTSWKNTDWKPIDQTWIGPGYSKEDFNGRYKILWDQEHLYVLAEITDDILMDKTADGLDKYWDDDCLEIFIDEDASGGNHQYNYNAFAYHISLDNKTVDIGLDSLPHYYNHINSARKTKGNTSVWELEMQIFADDFLPNSNTKNTSLNPQKQIGFAIAYCDNDTSQERENFIGSAVVKGEDKNKGWIDASVFEKFVLEE